MKIALFAAVEDEVANIKEMVHLTGIGRENATGAMLEFMRKHEGEEFTVLNIGTAGAHTVPVCSLLRITEIVSGGSDFLPHPMLTDRLPIEIPDLQDAKLFSSDCFVNTSVYSSDFLSKISKKADCFDMESSALYTVTKHFGKPYVSYKIVSDHLDVDLATWHQRVHDLSGNLCDLVLEILEKIRKTEQVELL